MLTAQCTQNGTGIIISGDYEDLYFLREAVSSLSGDRTSYAGYEEVHDVVQKFVFELLHAYRAERDSFKTNCDTPCYRFEILFPEAVFIADALNDYIILSEGDEWYVKALGNPALAEKITERHYIDIAFIRFFQASVWNEVRKVTGAGLFSELDNDYEMTVREKRLKYKNFHKDWVDILNIRYIKNGAGFLAEAVKKLTERDGEYAQKENAMREHANDGNIAIYMDLLDELRYPDDEEEEEDFYGFVL